MKRFGLTLMLILLTLPAWGQCGLLILNQATGDAPSKIVDAGKRLSEQGADPHFFIADPGYLLDDYVRATAKNCNWSSTYIALAVSPKAHKFGIFYGAAWHHDLDDDYVRIQNEYMKPSFKAGDWTSGLAMGASQVAARIVAARSEVHQGKITINQSTPVDYSYAFTVFLWWLGGALVLAFIIGFFVKRSKSKREALAEQARAKGVRAQAVAKLSAADPTDKNTIAASEAYSSLAGSTYGDPDKNGLTAEQYRSMTAGFWNIVNMLSRRPHDSFTPPKVRTRTNPGPKTSQPTTQPVTSEPPAAKTVEKETSDFFSSGVPVAPFYVPPVVVVEEEEHHHHHRRDSDDSSGSRSSSDWGSSSSNSSSDSGGGSSSWSSSSDFGGGGSSDFGGGGGDSGGGGSSSW